MPLTPILDRVATWSEFDWAKIAHHEAGHAVAAVVCGRAFFRVSIVPSESSGFGRVSFYRSFLGRVDGCDVSADMLALCRERAEREGVSVNLYTQAMDELDLPRRYRTIVVCGGFGLGGDRAQSYESLRRFYEHLEPGGLLLLDNEVPYADAGLWKYWLEEERAELPKPWGPPGERRLRSDGAEYALRSRVVGFDPLRQLLTVEMRADVWRDGEHVAEEEYTLTMTLYFTHELHLMLERVGFTDVVTRGDYTDGEPTAETDFVVFSARKPL